MVDGKKEKENRKHRPRKKESYENTKDNYAEVVLIFFFLKSFRRERK